MMCLAAGYSSQRKKFIKFQRGGCDSSALNPLRRVKGESAGEH